MRTTFVLITLATALLAGCGGGGGAAKLSTGDVAVVGSQHVTTADLNSLLTRAQKNYEQQGQKFPKQGTTNYETIRGQAVAVLVQQAMLYEKAASMGITVTDKEISARLAQIKKQYFGGSEKKYLAEIKKQGYTDAQIRSDVIRTQLISEAVQKQITKNLKVSDSEVQQYYTSHLSSYVQPATRQVRYILVGKSKSLALSVYNQLKAGNDKTWCTLTKKYAKDGSDKTCGKTTFSKGQTVAIFDKTAFSAPTGKVVKPFFDSSQYKAWFVIEPLGAVKPSTTTPEKQAAATIKSTVLSNKQKQAISDFSAGLKKTFCGGSKIKYQVGYAPASTQDPCAATTNATTTG